MIERDNSNIQLDKLKVNSPQYPYDMAHWCTEKMDALVAELGHHVTALHEKGIQDSTENEELYRHLSAALFVASKLLAFFAMADWALDDSEQILQDGFAGYQRIAVKYGLLEKTDMQRKAEAQTQARQALADFEARLPEYLAGPRSPNRTLLNQLLDDLFVRYPQFRTAQIAELEKLLDAVNIGVIDWGEFTARAQVIATSLKGGDSRQS